MIIDGIIILIFFAIYVLMINKVFGKNIEK